MKICIFTTTLDKNNGGPSRSVPILAKGLDRVGIHTTLVTCKSDDMNTHLLDHSNVNLCFIDKNISNYDLEHLFIKEHFDIIHGQNLWMPLYHRMAKIAKKNGIPYIITPRGCLEPWCLNQKYLKKRLALLLYQRSDLNKAACILATSKMEADNIRKLGVRTPISIIPNGIDISEYRCRGQETLSTVKKQICFVSRIHEKKGIEFLIQSWTRLNEIYPDWSIIIAGNGDDKYIDALNKLIEKKGLSKKVHIIPPVFGEAKYKLYCQSSLFVLPTYSENFGMVIAEAMSCGVPVITTSGTPWSVLNHKKLGWYIDLSIDNLTNALSEAIEMGTNNLFILGQKCSKYIYDTYQYTSVALKNKMMYEWLLGSSKEPSFINKI